MDTALVQKLEELLNGTREFLASPDPDVEAWEGYSKRRETIFAHLKEMDFQVAEEERAAVSCLIEEILQQDATVTEKVKAKLISVRGGISTLARARQALRGYTPPRPALLLERCA